MAKKKKQHFIPQVYLKAFTDKTIPAQWPANRPFKPGVWIGDRNELRSLRLKSPKNVLWRPRLYNVKADNPDHPWLEDAFARLEDLYIEVCSRLHVQADLTVEEYGILLIFIGALSGRTPEQMDHRQAFVDELERIYRMVDRGANSSERFSDEMFAGADEAGKRSIPTWTHAYADVIARGGFIIVNETPMQFITSDNPVTHRFMHIDELPVSAFPQERRASVLPNKQAFFSFTPLAPTLAFVSSPLLIRSDSLYWPTADLRLVFAVNQLTRQNAYKQIISAVPDPFGELTDALIGYEAEQALAAQPRTGILLYTERNRYWLPTDDAKHERTAHPLVTRITFSTGDLTTLALASSDERIRELTIYTKGHRTSHLKHAKFLHTGLTPSDRSIIETSLEDLGRPPEG